MRNDLLAWLPLKPQNEELMRLLDSAPPAPFATRPPYGTTMYHCCPV